jgi:pimeloyl-ACP methyl ester carboxylesterase
MSETEIAYMQVADRSIAYRLRSGLQPTLMFLPGYASDMEGAKASALDAFAAARGLAMLRLDYSGTGSSSGRFEDGTLALWLEEALAALDQLTSGPVILIGSSMGGWVALHLAQLRPERVLALVGIAAAPDFTDWGFTPDQAARLGADTRPTRAFWGSAQKLRLFDQPEIAVDCPVRLIHGERDEDVPPEIAFRTKRALRSSDVQVEIIKDGGHRLSEPHEIDAILATVGGLLEPKP